MAKIKDIRISTLALPLRETFRTALGERQMTRNVGVVVDAGDVKGYGEASTSLAMPEATPAAMMNVMGQSSRYLIGAKLEDWKGLSAEIAKRHPGQPTAVSALECALLDAFCRSKKRSIAKFFGGKKKSVETYYTVAALEPASAARTARRLYGLGFRKFKVKVTGQDLEADLKRIQSVFKSGRNVSLIVDANQGLDRRSALRLTDSLQAGRVRVDLIEQPLPKDDLEGLKFFKDRSPYPVCADESVRSYSDAEKIRDAGAADAFNLKLAKTGLLEALRIAALARSAGILLMIGCMMESAAGLSASVQWALGSGLFEFHDLDSFLLLSGSPENTGFANRGPILRLKPKILGSGVRGL